MPLEAQWARFFPKPKLTEEGIAKGVRKQLVRVSPLFLAQRWPNDCHCARAVMLLLGAHNVAVRFQTPKSICLACMQIGFYLLGPGG